MGGLLVLAFKVGGNVQPILMWIGINFVITVVGRGFISWQGHLGGFLGGVLIAAVLVYAPRERRTAWQAGGLGAFTVRAARGRRGPHRRPHLIARRTSSPGCRPISTGCRPGIAVDGYGHAAGSPWRDLSGRTRTCQGVYCLTSPGFPG